MNNPTRYRSWSEINLSTVQQNVDTVKQFLGPQIKTIFVAKADCMGFGLQTIVKKVLAAGADKIAVSELSEALLLRKAGITQPILLLYHPTPWEIKQLIENTIEISVSNPAIVDSLIKTANELQLPVKVDLYLETGMHRYGLNYQDISSTIQRLSSCKYISITSISSHFATSESDLEFAKKQLHQFIEGIKVVTHHCSTIESVHMANSAATALFVESWKQDTYKDLLPNAQIYVRTCRLLLGAIDIKNAVNVAPAFEKTVSYISEVQSIKKGDYIGYDKAFTADRDMNIATIPTGWANAGYFFSKSYVIVNGKRCPMVSTPSANAMTIENCADAKVGDTVYLVKQDGIGEQFTLQELADLNNISQTHITASLGKFLPRVYTSQSEE